MKIRTFPKRHRHQYCPRLWWRWTIFQCPIISQTLLFHSDYRATALLAGSCILECELWLFDLIRHWLAVPSHLWSKGWSYSVPRSGLRGLVQAFWQDRWAMLSWPRCPEGHSLVLGTCQGWCLSRWLLRSRVWLLCSWRRDQFDSLRTTHQGRSRFRSTRSSLTVRQRGIETAWPVCTS